MWDQIETVWTQDIYDGKSLQDLFTLEMLATLLGNVMAASLILILGFIISGWVRRRIVRIGQSYDKVDNTLFHFLGNLARYVLLAFAFLFVLNTFGVRTTSLVAAIGAAGVAIGLALQGTLSNVAAGVMIVLFRPFKIGDFVEAGGVTGIVEGIQMFNTIMRTGDNREIIVPNGQIYSDTITNFSARDTRRIDLVIGVGYLLLHFIITRYDRLIQGCDKIFAFSQFI